MPFMQSFLILNFSINHGDMFFSKEKTRTLLKISRSYQLRAKEAEHMERVDDESISGIDLPYSRTAKVMSEKMNVSGAASVAFFSLKELRIKFRTLNRP